MSDNPQVSIVIDNYNYCQFLPEAIDSTLAQTYGNTEVIVVDDGSTDGSRAVIARYGDRIIPVMRDNGGQAAAFNSGLARSRGDIVIFLDSDDTLLPHIAARVVEVFKANSTVVSVHYRLKVIDEHSRETGRLEPPGFCPMPNGYIRDRFATMFDHIAWPATSGNAFLAPVLRSFFPLDEREIRGCTDYYVQRAAALFGPVLSLSDEIGGCYRVHGKNYFYRTTLDLDQLRWTITTRVSNPHKHIIRLADSLGLNLMPRDPAALADFSLLARRLISLKLDPDRHPYAGDTLASLCRRGVLASLQAPDLMPVSKLMHGVWFVVMSAAPRPLTEWLTRQQQNPQISVRVMRARDKLRAVAGRLSAPRPVGRPETSRTQVSDAVRRSAGGQDTHRAAEEARVELR